MNIETIDKLSKQEEIYLKKVDKLFGNVYNYVQDFLEDTDYEEFQLMMATAYNQAKSKSAFRKKIDKLLSEIPQA